MTILIKKAPDIKSSEITDPEIYKDRRRFIKQTVLAMGGIWAMQNAPMTWAGAYPNLTKSPFSTDEETTSLKDVSGYNNFYEFGTSKTDPAQLAKDFQTKPWTITVEGEAKHTGSFQLEDFIKPYTLEERIYRLRCVEGWSMVIPWVGFPLADMIKRFEPNSKARFVEFTTLHDPKRMPGQNRDVLDWPYVEALRIDEAMHPLTLLAVGLYGDVLPNQNGAPLRLVVPWKYGFKSIKSIVKIRFTEQQPKTTWNVETPSEYGFYANVNPEVDHPRWSQGKERRIGEFRKRNTLMFNGYAEHVAHLYSGMDLKKYF